MSAGSVHFRKCFEYSSLGKWSLHHNKELIKISRCLHQGTRFVSTLTMLDRYTTDTYWYSTNGSPIPVHCWHTTDTISSSTIDQRLTDDWSICQSILDRYSTDTWLISNQYSTITQLTINMWTTLGCYIDQYVNWPSASIGWHPPLRHYIHKH